MSVTTKKFSQFADGGDLTKDNVTVGVESGANTRFNNPWPNLPAGSTGDRPVIDPEMYYRLRFNTTIEEYEYYSPTTSTWISVEDGTNILPLLASNLAGEGASLIGIEDQGFVLGKTVQDMANATFITQTNTGSLNNAQFLSVLPDGFTSVTAGTGVLSSRQFIGSANQIDLTNADGSGDPTWSISLTLNVPGTLDIQSTTAIDSILDEDDMISDSPTALATQQSIKTYVDSSILAPGGFNGQIQFNNGGVFNGDPQFLTNGLGDISIVGELTVDALHFDVNEISTATINTDMVLSPNGTGAIILNSDSVLVGANIQHFGNVGNRISFGTDTQDYQTGSSSRLDVSDLGVRLGAANSRVTTILDEDDMISDSDTALSTQQAIKAYVDSQVVIGVIVQYVLATSAAIDATSSITYVPSSLSATITPTNIANKIMVYCFAPNSAERVSGNIAERYSGLRVQNITDAVTIAAGWSGRLRTSGPSTSTSFGSSTLIGEETVPSVNPTTYELQFFSGNTTALSTINPTGTGPALMLILELLV